MVLPERLLIDLLERKGYELYGRGDKRQLLCLFPRDTFESQWILTTTPVAEDPISQAPLSST